VAAVGVAQGGFEGEGDGGGGDAFDFHAEPAVRAEIPVTKGPWVGEECSGAYRACQWKRELDAGMDLECDDPTSAPTYLEPERSSWAARSAN
jgi:hypothetical protein